MTASIIPEGSVVITPTEMYREMLATHQAVRDVSGKLDSALGDTARRLDGIDKDISEHESRSREVHADHETRLRSLERRIWVGIGAASAVSSSAAVLITRAMGAH